MKSRAARKAELMKEAEARIEALLDWAEKTNEPTLEQIEEVVLGLRQKIGEEMAQAVVEGEAATRPVPEPGCPKCKQQMRYKGEKVKEITSWVGELKLKRGYYYCDHCASGLFPPG